MSEWTNRRALTRLDDVSRFLQGLEAQPRLRARLQARGYTEQVHRELQTCLARAADLGDPRAPVPRRGGTRPSGPPGQAWAVVSWAAEEARLASAALRKVPAVMRELQRLARKAREEPPLEVLRASGKLATRVGSDEHLGHFLTLGGLRDASRELGQRLREGGSTQARADRRQAHRELGFHFARWKAEAQDELSGEPSALRALGLDP